MASSGWQVRYSSSKQRPYFYNESQGLSIWEPPTGLSDEEIVNLPGARENLHRQPDPQAASQSQSQPDSVQASHILIKHAGSRRPSSWKEAFITRSKEDAISELQQHQATLKALPQGSLPAEFAKIASTESHCSSHSAGGDLGPFRRNQMQKPFEDAAFGLPVGGMSGIIETDSGVHLVLRTA